jgi:threonine/homoserine/homoserine lactone efflux protein
VTVEVGSPVLTSFGVGTALASAPGPVQAVLLAEAVRGGLPRGFRAMAGANLTFGLLLVGLALGLSLAPPRGPAIQVLRLLGGALLLWLSVDGFRSAGAVEAAPATGRALPPAARGALAVLLNPGAWLFLGAVASPLFASAARHGGAATALVAVAALVVGLAIGDGTVVLVGGVGVRRASVPVRRLVGRVLAAVLAGLGGWLLLGGAISLAAGNGG